MGYMGPIAASSDSSSNHVRSSNISRCCDGAIMKRIGGQKDSFADQPSHPKGRAAISLRQEPGSLQDELNDPAPRCWRKVLVLIILKEIVFVSRVGGGVVQLVHTGEEVGIW